VKRGRRPNAQRIAELEALVLQLRDQMQEKDVEIVRLLLAAEERKTEDTTIKRHLEEYQREQRAIRSVVNQVLKDIAQLDPNINEAGVGPEALPTEGGSESSPMEEDMVVANIKPLLAEGDPDTVSKEQRPNISVIESCSVAEDMVIDDNNSSPCAVGVPKTTSELMTEQDEEHPREIDAVHSDDTVPIHQPRPAKEQLQEQGRMSESHSTEMRPLPEGIQSGRCQGISPADDLIRNALSTSTNNKASPQSAPIVEVGTANEGTAGTVEALNPS